MKRTTSKSTRPRKAAGARKVAASRSTTATTSRKRKKPLSTIGRVIEERGLRAGWVVERSGVKYGRLLDLRAGKVKPRKSEVAALAKVFGMKPTELVDNYEELSERTREPRVLTKKEVQYIRDHAGKVPVLEMQRHLKMKRIYLLRYIHEQKLPVMRPGTRRRTA
jgi:hypothetical protein